MKELLLNLYKQYLVPRECVSDEQPQPRSEQLAQLEMSGLVSPEQCGCRGGPTLAVLQDVQRAYENQMEALESLPQNKRLQAQADVLRSWVGDLVGQNSLLARAVEELEAEATAQLARERRRHMEIVSELRAELSAQRRRLARKDNDLRGLLEVLRRLRELDTCGLAGIHFHELTEEDIFGSVPVLKTLEQGDSYPNFRPKSDIKSYRRRRK